MNIITSIARAIFKHNDSGILYASITFILITINAIIRQKKGKILVEFIKNPKTFFSFFLIIIWCFLVYVYSTLKNVSKENVEKVKNATKKALLAFIIAFFAKLDLVIAPFWLVWIIAYYLEGWI